MAIPTNTGATRPTHRLRRGIAAALLGTTMLVGGAALVLPAAPSPALAAAAVEAPVSFADLAQRVSPAVVNVSATHTAEKAGSGMPDTPFPPGSPFEEFFRRFQDQFGRGGEHDEAPRGRGTSLGSGFVIDPSGYVVTNNHVIEGASDVKITMQNGTELPAKVIGRDAKTDIALLKVDPAKPLPALTWGDSDAARVGDWVMAVGNPFGLGGSVTKGIISARGRDIQAGPYDDFLQIDASINRGNSGGPTFDLDGKVIGINTAIFSPNGGSVGIGFAIPSNLARQVVAQLKEHGHVERGWLGVRIQPVTPELADGLGLDKAEGALVADVTPDSPAAKAGLRQGDVIVKYGDHEIDQIRDLTRQVAQTQAGSRVTVTVIRQGKERRLEARIDRMPDQPRMASAETGQGRVEKSSVETVHGLKLAPLDSATRVRLGIKEDTQGVVVAGIDGKAVGNVAVRPGDVIVQVGDSPVGSPGDAVRRITAAEKSGQKAVLLLINRQGTESFVALGLRKA